MANPIEAARSSTPHMHASFLTPFILGTLEQFTRLRQLLISAGFNEQTVCQRSAIKTIFDFELRREGARDPKPFTDRLDLLLRVLMHGHLGRESDVLAILSSNELALFENLGVLARREDDPSLLYATAALYPVENVYVTSDRTIAPSPDSKVPVPADVVFAAISRHTRTFLGSIPRDPCERLLDLCCGSGIAALLAGANFAKWACAADLGARSVHFSEFSRRLNGLDHVSTAHGDLYDAVPGQQFDRIVAHPPFIPSKTQAVLFRDGGEDGEQIFRRVIEGLPEVLAPGGRLHCVTYATDRKTGQLEDRIRTWLGAYQAEFDVILVASEQQDRSEAFAKNIGKMPGREFFEFQQHLDQLGVTRQFHGSVMVQRKPRNRPAFSARIVRSPRAPLAAVEQYRSLITTLHAADAAQQIAHAKPVLPSDLRLLVTHSPSPAGFVPTEYLVRTSEPWVSEAQTEAGIALVLSRCTGTRTLSDLFAELLAEDALSDGTTFEQFTQMLRPLVLHGFLLLEPCRNKC